MSKLDSFIAALPAMLFIALKVAVVVGAAGTALKSIGTRFSKPKLVSLGEYLEHLGTNIPEIVNKLKGFFPKVLPAALMLVVACGCAPAMIGCANMKPAAVAASVPNDIAIAFRAAGSALAVADVINVAYMDSLVNPTQADVDRETAITDKLVAIKKTLDDAQKDLAHSREQLREAVGQIRDAEALLALAGVKMPGAVDAFLNEGEKVLQ